MLGSQRFTETRTARSCKFSSGLFTDVMPGQLNLLSFVAEKNRGALLETIDIDILIGNCKIYRILVPSAHYNNIIVMFVMADDREDPLGQEVLKTIYSVAELSSWRHHNCSYNLECCQRHSQLLFCN